MAFADVLQAFADQDLRSAAALRPTGRVTRMVGLSIEAAGCSAPVGTDCELRLDDGTEIAAEVVGFKEQHLLLMPAAPLRGLSNAARVRTSAGSRGVPAGAGLIGRVVDANGVPIDDQGPLRRCIRVPLDTPTVNPLSRAPIDTMLDVGVRSLNALLPLGRGQRVGLFAGSGVGKSVLLGMMTRHTDADVVVVGLVGERGREVREFIDDALGRGGRERAVVVAAPADDPPLMRLRGAQYATRVAEHFRAQGQHVLLLLDSLTRYAQAQREIALAIGEPPVARGYPPSVFTRLPALCERAGNAEAGSITAVYTVLVEGDEMDDPVVDSARAVLDGHIVLSRDLANAGVFPAVDLGASASRLFDKLAGDEQKQLTTQLRQAVAAYGDVKDLIAVGAYVPGADPQIDLAAALWPRALAFLRQAPQQGVGIDQALAELRALFAAPAGESVADA